ncbi:MAG: hypothetical protein NWR73_09435 [Flavobacteriales bacterium]|nr:hypothetical protein [Flavobacteriales bacterium]
MKYLLNFIITLSATLACAQNTIDLNIHARVDTTNKEVMEVVQLWKNYLSSSPDKIYDNPYWNEEEKAKYTDFDFTRSALYALPAEQLLNYYKPTLLSVEKDDVHYVLRTIFNAEGLQGQYKKSNPWCITRVYAVNENGQWRLKNALPMITANWQQKTVGKITFIYPADHDFNLELALDATAFCDEVAKKFQFNDWQPFDYYIAKNGDELGELLGFDFFFSGYTTGKGMVESRILLSGIDSEWYPHEFIHILVENKPRHRLIDEGFATWLGGTAGKTFDEGAYFLAEQLVENKSITIYDILNNWGREYAAFYTTGAIICNLVYEKGGVAAIKKLLNTAPDDEALFQTVCELLDVKRNDLNQFLRKETLKYLNPNHQ